MLDDGQSWAGSFSVLDTRDLDAAMAACVDRLAQPASSAAEVETQLDTALALGMLLLSKARIDDAVRILELSAEGRRVCYGPDDPRYAIGLAASAEALLAKGGSAGALERISEASSILLDRDHELAPAALALEAEVLIQAEASVKPFLDLDDIDEPIAVRIADETHRRARRLPPISAYGMYTALDRFTSRRFVTGHPTTIRARAARARTAPSARTRVKVLVRLVEALESADAIEALVDAMLELGLAHAQSGANAAALTAHEIATERARDADDRTVRARALRMYALCLLDSGRTDDAKVAVERAEAEAESAASHDEVARIVATKAVVLFHARWLDAAAAELMRAERLLDTHAPERVWIDSYRQALRSGTTSASTPSHLADAHARAHAEGEG